MMKVKVGDTVKIIAGKDKGKEGKVLVTLKKKDRVVVEGINMIKKHQKPNNANETGGIFDRESSIHVSNVKVTKAKEKAAKKETKKEEKPKKETKPKTESKKA